MPDDHPLSDVTPSHDHRWTAVIIFLSIVVLAPGVIWGFPFGKAIAGADRILLGQIPYRDFWTMYAPGQFYLTAALFWVFGRHLMVQGIAAVILLALSGGMLFRLGQRMQLPRWMNVLIAALYVAGQWTSAPEMDSYLPAMPLLLIGAERVLCFIQGGNRRCLWIAGFLIGIAAWFKHDVAAYVCASAVLAIFILGISQSKGVRDLISPVIVMIGACMVTFLPLSLVIVCKAPTDVWNNLILFPAKDFRGVRSEAYPSVWIELEFFRRWLEDPSQLYRLRIALQYMQDWILCNLPQLVLLVSACVTLVQIRTWKPQTRTVVVFWIAFLTLFWLAAHVQRNTHVYSMAIASLVLLGMAWRFIRNNRERSRPLQFAFVLGFAVCAIGLLLTPVLQISNLIRKWPESRRMTISGAQGIRISAPDFGVYHPIIEFIQEFVSKDERIYVGLKRHDATVINDLRFYYLSQRRNCCRYDELHPGITDRLDVQNEIIDSINRHDVRCIVLWDFGWSSNALDQVRDRSARTVEGGGAFLLDAYIAENFSAVRKYGDYLVMWRNGSAQQPGQGRLRDDGRTANP